jgi:ubiquitin-conjugating enzyme E2 Q
MAKYPRAHRYMIFANDDVVPTPVQSALRMPPASTAGMSVLDVIRYITRILTAELEAATGADGYLDAFGLGDDDLESNAGDSDVSEYEVALHDFEDEDHALPPPRLEERLPSIFKKLSRTAHKNLKRDLTAAIRVGIRPKLLHDTEVHLHSIFALPFKVARLGVPEATLEAWDLDPNHFIVLLMQLNGGDPNLRDFLVSDKGEEQITFRLGKCKSDEPSLSSARLTFSRSHWQDANKGSTQSDEPSEVCESAKGGASDTFLAPYLFSPINEILGEYLPRLIRLRRTQKLSWDEAQECVCQDERRQDKTTPADKKPPKSRKSDPLAEPIISQSVSSALQPDFALEDEEDFSLPLVAMQFALRRLARCTEFCMVCHRKIKGGYEAVKPFVCEDHLCLFKYMNLGLGRAAEHEIIQQPYVVDLLISFFAAAINSQSRTSIPPALGIKTFDEHKGFAASADFSKREVWFDKKAGAPRPDFPQGASFVIGSGPSEIHPWPRGQGDKRKWMLLDLTLRQSSLFLPYCGGKHGC